MRRARAVRFVCVGAGAGVCCSLAGCGVGLVFPSVMGTVGAPVAFVSASALPHGPTVTVVNEADEPIDVRLWVGRVDAFAAQGFVDQRTGDDMVATVPGGETHKIQGGRTNWVTGQLDGVVWVRLQTTEGVEWYEFERPGPYRIVAHRADFDWFAPGPIQFSSGNDQAMTPLPESAWIDDHDGAYAITASPIEIPSPTPKSGL